MDDEQLGTMFFDAFLAGVWNMLLGLPGAIVSMFELYPWMWLVVIILVAGLFVPRRRSRRR